jgi:DNA mismatch repair ATPase MutS
LGIASFTRALKPNKTLFATHYHELNEMSESLPRIQNYNVAVKELKDTVLLFEN